MRIAALSLALAAMAGAVSASGVDHVTDPIVLVESGVFCPNLTAGQREAPGTESGFIKLIDGEATVDFHTHTVPGQLEMGFGMRFRLADGELPRSAMVTVTHPPTGPRGVTEESWMIELSDQSLSMTLFSFDEPYEVQFGTWTMAVSVAGEELLHQTFDVVPPEATPVSIDMCEGPALMS